MKRFLMIAVLTASAATAQAAPLDIFSKIFVFGDSLSDGGNVDILTGGAAPGPEFPGNQFTDGDTWATQLGLMPSLAGGTNHAFGGARARDDAALTPDAVAQIVGFALSGATIDDQSLATMWVGGNDVRDALFALEDSTLIAVNSGAQQINDAADAFFSNGTILDEALDAVSVGLTLLTNSNLKNIAVVGLPNFARVPELQGIAATLGALGGTALDIAKAVSQGFNERLLAQINALPNGITANYVDIFGLFEDIAADPSAFGFTNIQTPCLVALQTGTATDCSSFLYYDAIHPTEAAHALVAQRFTSTVAPVPLPAGGLLLLAGLGGLALLRSRQIAA